MIFAIIDNLIIPEIIKQTGIENFEEEFRVKYGKYEMLYYQVMYYAEEAKKELSQAPATAIEFSAMLNDKNYDFYIPITREAVDKIFLPLVNETIALLNKVLENNHLTAKDINEIILVGGSTSFAAGKRTTDSTNRHCFKLFYRPNNFRCSWRCLLCCQ
ncbi:MAG: Hsp70 family protein [Ferruginibacter sp.]